MHRSLAQPSMLVVFACLAFALAGCGTTKESLFGDTAQLPDMATVYHRHMAGGGPAGAGGARGLGPGAYTAATYHQLVGYSRDTLTELDQRFPRLPNPTLLMYVDPHLTADGHPVPGYTTAFTLYERVEYALPGEVPPRARAPSIVPGARAAGTTQRRATPASSPAGTAAPRSLVAARP